ncbi:MAG: putative toxin-antitoxin system toxin component, PIN family [Actinobacteria bacterium]|nr:putative toxin-antitoxin system toxin component, PIN family [Actinomycetota bacterium]
MRVVFDTNILVSAFIFPGGAPETIYRAALEGRTVLVTSAPLLAELGRVLVEKFGWEAAMAEEVVAQVIRIGLVVQPTERVHEIAADPADDRVLEAAVAGNADAIVSGDRHLTRLRSWRGIPIRTAAELAAELASQT